MRRALACIALGACVHQAVTIEPQEVFEHRVELAGGAAGSSSIFDSNADRHALRPDEVVEVVDLRGQRQRVTLARLAAACADTPVHCAARYPTIVVGDERHVRGGVKTAIALTVVLGTLGGLVACTAECSSPGDYLSGATLGLIAVGTVALFIAALGGIAAH